ncbi:chromate efflux transporter [Acinetobacter sp. YH12071]|uniref:chromate efflux transporter n=1 Tax=Acinetobacter sp. YH12071 TaxID=2601067 RepID=UPI0015D13D3B|nr:chromate efflux transporter [Acinetobacter sp. YH12071]
MSSLSYSQIFLIFFKLGCLSFGGPAAHLVFFHQTFVQRLHWLKDEDYAQVVALAQLLPGPTSSQVGLAIGYLKRGYLGSVVAWLGFTLPSALLMTLLAFIGQQLFPWISSAYFHAIQLIVLAVVFWAFWQMLQSFCKSWWQYLLMLVSALMIWFLPLSYNQILVIVLAGLAGMWIAKTQPQSGSHTTPSFQLEQRSFGSTTLWLILFICPFLLLGALNWINPNLLAEGFLGFYQSAALVFGGGHIILPLLHQDFVSTGMISAQQFDLGYAFAQLMPGPLFSFASYVGYFLDLTAYPVLNAIIATIAIFLPSFFLIFATLPHWSWLMHQDKIKHAVIGINAAVVGLLLALIVDLGQDYLTSVLDLAFVMFVIVLLKSKLPVWVSLIGSFGVYMGLLSLLS